MRNIIFFTGVHATGKTTLAKLFAEKHDLRFVETKCADIFIENGFDIKADLNFRQRFEIQKKVMARVMETIDAVPADEVVVMDRSPLDVIAYTAAEFNMSAGFALEQDEELAEAVKWHIETGVDKMVQKTLAMFCLHHIQDVSLDSKVRASLHPAYLTNLKCSGFHVAENMVFNRIAEDGSWLPPICSEGRDMEDVSDPEIRLNEMLNAIYGYDPAQATTPELLDTASLLAYQNAFKLEAENTVSAA